MDHPRRILSFVIDSPPIASRLWSHRRRLSPPINFGIEDERELADDEGT